MTENTKPSLYNLIDQILISHPAFTRTTDRIGQFFHAMEHASDPLAIAIVGESRTGKSRSLEYFEQLHPPVRESEGRSVPFLRVRVPSKPTVRGLAELLLHALGDPKFDKGTEIAKTARLKQMLKQAKTIVTALDEFQHFEDKTTHLVQHHVADWLKVLIDDTRMGLVVTGLPSSLAVIRQNEQLAGRFMAPVHLRRFRWEDDNDRADFIDLLATLADSLEPFRLPYIASEEMAVRLYCATGGLIGYLMKLLKQATWNALDQNTNDIPLTALAQAFEESVMGEELPALKGPNPFDPQFREKPQQIGIALSMSIGTPIRVPPTVPLKRGRKPRQSLGDTLSAS